MSDEYINISYNNNFEDEYPLLNHFGHLEDEIRPLIISINSRINENNEIENGQNPFNNIDDKRKKLVNNLLEYEINKVDKLEESNKKCMICLEYFNNGDKIISLPCVHIYHGDCIKKWLLGNNFCPICKYTFNDDDFNN